MSRLLLIENVFEKDALRVIEFEGPITPVLQSLFTSFPEHGHLFFGHVSEDNRILVNTPEQVAQLNAMSGDFYMVNAPGSFIPAIVWYIIGAIVLSVLLRPKIPNISQRNTQQSSPNNELSERTNQARPGQRIPDIFGLVRSTPDMIAQTYSRYMNNIEHEVSLMCIGRGYYAVLDARDDTTPISQITGSQLEVYDPGYSVGLDEPFYVINGKINEDFPTLFPSKSNSVNGQTLRAPNNRSVAGEMYGRSDGSITMWWPKDKDKDFDFRKVFETGDLITLTMGDQDDSSIPPQTTNAAIQPTPYNGIYITAATKPPLLALGSFGQTLTITSGTFSIMDSVQVGTEPNPAYPADPSAPETLPVYAVQLVRIIDLSGTYTVNSVSSSGSYYLIQFENPQAVAADWQYVLNPSSPTQTIPYANRMITVLAPGTTFNLSGAYTAGTVNQYQLYFNNPVNVNGYWATLPASDADAAKNHFNGIMAITGQQQTIGPFIIDVAQDGALLLNFIALNGIYKDDGQKQYSFMVSIEITYWLVDADGNALGPEETQQHDMLGSAVTTETVADSKFILALAGGKYKVQCRRISDTDLAFKGQVVDEVKWSALYALAPAKLMYNDVTIVKMVQAATAGALAIKERKLNMLVERKLPVFNPSTGLFDPMVKTMRAEDAFIWCLADKYIGAMTLDDFDGQQILDTLKSVRDYFNIGDYPSAPTEFCYTFDKDNTTVEETLQMIANAAFCTAYRGDGKIKLNFLKNDSQAVLLFNHRNKLPNSETRAFRFGTENQKEGVQYVWVNPTDDSLSNMTYPPGAPTWNLKKVESVGVRNEWQATLHAAREWAIVKYQYLSTEFDALSHGELLMFNDVILISNNTSFKTYDGEVMSQNGAQITTSQPLDDILGKRVLVFLQLPDKLVQMIEGNVTGVNTITLLSAPNMPLVTDLDSYSRSGYQAVAWENVNDEPLLFLVTEVTPNNNNSVKIKAAVWDEKLFEGDGKYWPQQT